jgi:hypothetical protein
MVLIFHSLSDRIELYRTFQDQNIGDKMVDYLPRSAMYHYYWLALWITTPLPGDGVKAGNL